MASRTHDLPEILPPGTGFVAGEALLREIAVALAGWEDFGANEYEEGLGVLLASLDADADLSEAGRRSWAGMILTALAGRLLSEKAMAANPGFRDAPLGAPIVIVGLPRTGTTFLQGMLCADPAAQGLELFLAQSPGPRPPRDSWEATTSWQRCVAMLEQMPEDMRAIHPMHPAEPDECWHLLRQSFTSVTFECAARVRGYSRWWARHDMRAAYRRWADNLRLVGMQDAGRQWVLKDPSHLFACDALLDAAPRALIVMTHRDPACSIPSVASLNSFPREMNDRVPDAAGLGAEQQELWARGMERMMDVRRKHPERFCDVHFAELHEDPLGVARRVPARAGRELSGEGERSMRAWAGSHPPHPHRYDAARFGLRAEAIRERFSGYIGTFDVALEERD